MADVVRPDVLFASYDSTDRIPSEDQNYAIQDVNRVNPVNHLAQNNNPSSPDNLTRIENNRAAADRSADTGIDGPNDRLIDRVEDPTSWLMQFRFRENWNWPLAGSGQHSQQFQFRPTIPFKAWDKVSLLRVTVPYDIQGSGAPGLDQVEIFDALVLETDWGR
jgi:hypothetical protein